MIAIGLHITKCAGTSLAAMVRQRLTADRYFLCSSFGGALRRGEPSFWEIPEPARLRFVFGHYVHESLIHYFGRKNVFLFTGLRDPIRRAVSDYSQMCHEERLAGRPLPTAEQYLSTHSDTICVELVRAFPTLAQACGGVPLFERAAAVLSLFDCVYNSDAFEQTIQPVLAVLGMEGATIKTENVSRDADDDFVLRQRALIAQVAEEKFANDVRLFQMFAPYFGQVRPAGEQRAVGRPGWWDVLPKLGPRDQARHTFTENIKQHMVAEFNLLGQCDELKRLATQRVADWTDILSRLDRVRP